STSHTLCFLLQSRDHRYLHSFPTRRSSDLLPVLRDRLPDVLDLFDFAEPSLVTGDRQTTNVPVQALYLMNSQFVQARASGLARRDRKSTRLNSRPYDLVCRLLLEKKKVTTK